ncbi:MAG: hypothetical protein MMC33_000744 [Icmadophila ericetorum]|nr:hypothetical protein [Icmadophila ericetorum]
MSTAGAAPAPLPELPYSLRDHKKGIAVTWTIILANTCFVPLGLTYGLWFGTHPQINQHLLFGITSVAFTVASAFQYWMRIFRLLQQDPIYRPIGSQRGWLDFYQIASTIATIISIAVFVIGLTLNPVSVRLLATPPSIVILISSASLLLTSGLTLIGARTPFRISSMPAGSICRPGIYSIIEDVIAVDTGTGRKYREALNERYQSSGAFRKMLLNLNLFWALGGCVFGSVVIALCYEEVVDPIAAYGIGKPCLLLHPYHTLKNKLGSHERL